MVATEAIAWIRVASAVATSGGQTKVTLSTFCHGSAPRLMTAAAVSLVLAVSELERGARL